MRKMTTLTGIIGISTAYTPITITENGQNKTLFIVGTSTLAQSDENSFSIGKNSRVYFTTDDKMGPNNWYMPNLLGGSIEYDLDISQTGGSCDFAVYLTRMPWVDENGDPAPQSDKTYYCDANGI